MANKTSNYPTAQQPSVSAEEMSLLIEHMNELQKMPRVKDIDGIEKRIQYYFEYCINNSIRPGVEGMCLALGTSRQTLLNWQNEGGKKGELIDRAKQLIAALLENWSVTGKINPVTAIFLMKNHFNYVDKAEVEVAPKQALGEHLTVHDIAARIAVDDD